MTALAEVADREEIMRLYPGPWKRQGTWDMTHCPAHADGARHHGRGGESLGLSDAGVLRCFAGCSFADVMGVIRERAGVPLVRAEKVLTATYLYRALDGTLVAEKGRFEAGIEKSFSWRLPGVHGWNGGLGGMKMPDLPLYRPPGFDEMDRRPCGAPEVFFVEGEKAAAACCNRHYPAVSAGGGAGQRQFGAGLELLRGRDVLLWPDNDKVGRDYMEGVAEALRGTARVHWVDWKGAPDKGDAFDFLAMRGDIEDLLYTDSPSWAPQKARILRPGEW